MKIAAFPLIRSKAKPLSDFGAYLSAGYHHIASVEAQDHILYIVTLVIGFSLWHWKRVLWAVTAFTLGHSLTLALSTLNIVRLPRDETEMAISISILISAFYVAFRSQKSEQKLTWIFYSLTVLFGLMHGLGYSTSLQSMMGEGESILVPLLGFNIGVELGQLLIVAAVMVLNLIVEHIFDIKKANWILFSCGFVTCWALKLIFGN